jgi:exopolysaccharide biosynthesis polyprenyl glycosylphosphotransferase
MSNHRVGLFFSNLFSIIISFLIAYLSRFGWDPSDVAFRHLKDSTVFLYLLLSFLIVFTFYRYNPITAKRGILRHIKAAFLTNIFMAIIFSTIVYTTHISDSIPRLFFGTFFSINFSISFSCLFLIHLIKRQYLEHHTKKTIIITDNSSLEKAVYDIQKLNSEDCEIIGITSLSGKQADRFYKVKILSSNLKTQPSKDTDSFSKNPALESIKLKELSFSTLEYVKRHQVDLVIFSVNHLARKKIEHLIEAFSEMGIDSLITIDSFAIETLETKLEDFGTTNVIRLSPRLFTDGELLLKRLMDIAGALVGCFICLIFGLIVAPLIFLEDPGPIIFKQKRVGRNGKFFYIYKFRSMYQDAEAKLQTLKDQNEMQGFMFKMKNDPRITKIGKILRKTSIDELPQFFNVLEGSMSLIGTRPPTVDEYNQYSAHHKRRISIKPGITGLWQVSGRSEITDFEEIVRLDCFYIDHWSITGDIKILLKTFAAVFTGKGSE